jgi:hypothetical protein
VFREDIASSLRIFESQKEQEILRMQEIPSQRAYRHIIKSLGMVRHVLLPGRIVDDLNKVGETLFDHISDTVRNLRTTRPFWTGSRNVH